MSVRPLPAAELWWLPWVCGMTFALLGWLSPAQIAITLGLEIALAAHHARQRTLLSEGVIAKDGGTLSSGQRSLEIRAGERLSLNDREFYGSGMRTLLCIMALCAAGCIAAFTRFAGVTWWASLTWLGWTAVTLWTERQQFERWRASDAPATADPSSHMNPVLVRTLTMFVAAFPVIALMPEQDQADPSRAALAIGSCLLLTSDMAAVQGARRLWTWLHTPSAPPAEATVPSPAAPPEVVYRRLPAPDPDWTPAPHWAPAAGWYGGVPGWEQRTDGTWHRTSAHPYGAAPAPTPNPLTADEEAP